MDNMPQQLLSRFTTHAKNALNSAVEISKKHSNKYVGSIHIAYGIIKEQGSIGFAVIKNYPIKISDLEEQIKSLPKLEKWNLEFSENFWHAIKFAGMSANNFDYNYLGTEHLLIGILSTQNSDFLEILKKKKIEALELKKNVRIIFESSVYFPEVAKMFDRHLAPSKETRNKDRQNKSALETFGTDLTQKAADSELDLIIGREKEVAKLINILGRKNKNNPMLIGDPGVGKTAIVHRLAQKIVENSVPSALIGKRIISIDLALLVAGTMFRGEFESRIKNILEEATEDENVLLFIDEIHTIVGAGSASGSLDAANILKPALTRGEFQCIGATTLEEYKKYIEKDAALERRFQTISVEEPTTEEAFKIITGVKHIYEEYHNISISDDAVKTAVDLSAQYLQSRKLPDKALDLMDEASAKAKSEQTSKQNFLSELKQLENEKRQLEYQKEDSIKSGDYEKAIIERDKIKKLDVMYFELKQAQNKLELELPRTAIASANITELISENTGIPVTDIKEKESLNLSKIEKQLGQKIVGQDEAISIISKAIRRSRAGLANPKRPIGSYMFLGPTGVGKTELAKTIAEKIFNNSKSLIKIDMSEFSERHTVSRLIGAPAGYVGYEEGGRLTEQIKRNPYSVILFDEIEKAHPEVLNILLQIMEDGILTDSSGRIVNFRNALIIITSNIGTNEFTQEAKIGFDHASSKKVEQKYEEIKNHTLEELKNQMLPEILSRLSDIIVFKPLGKKEIEKIIKIELDELTSRIKAQKNIILKTTKQIQTFLAKKAFIPEDGARSVRNVIQNYIEDPLTEMIVSREIVEGTSCEAKLEKDKITIKRAKISYSLKATADQRKNKCNRLR